MSNILLLNSVPIWPIHRYLMKYCVLTVVDIGTVLPSTLYLSIPTDQIALLVWYYIYLSGWVGQYTTLWAKVTLKVTDLRHTFTSWFFPWKVEIPRGMNFKQNIYSNLLSICFLVSGESETSTSYFLFLSSFSYFV